MEVGLVVAVVEAAVAEEAEAVVVVYFEAEEQ